MNESTAFENWTSAPIAIYLSGGGYRAAAFHLGTLAYLNRVNLLKNVVSIATVSGGP
jgi:predicted acylesterase/phospholipase RssA